MMSFSWNLKISLGWLLIKECCVGVAWKHLCTTLQQVTACSWKLAMHECLMQQLIRGAARQALAKRYSSYFYHTKYTKRFCIHRRKKGKSYDTNQIVLCCGDKDKINFVVFKTFCDVLIWEMWEMSIYRKVAWKYYSSEFLFVYILFATQVAIDQNFRNYETRFWRHGK